MTTTSGRTRRPKRLRLDQLLVDRGLASTRERARALILARDVRVDGDLALRAAEPVALEAELSVQAPPRYVSRGGLKLEHALDHVGERGGVSIEGARCLDIGSSTGGFTDCLLQHGAAHVTAVDVDYGGLATRLRDDPRVAVRERTNARFLEPLDAAVDVITLDVAFISLTTVLRAVLRSLRPGGDVLALVKPQFEAARGQVQRGGVVHDPAVHAATVARVALWAIERGMRVRGVIRSPLVGPAGNREFFLWLRRG
ncbi:MAG: TlyA family RNA methyltransferase [Dehalococcoidia bacterium]|jgi:23S rRNA (cytidine1920-2'-O)/16S rRNA (cytidine1409-2'-O)-methyltransferase|nr:TlyA family RNA methyltransferase [Dehalococcoidia bacterium]